MPSKAPKTRERSAVGTQRCMSVNPEMSSAALARPTTARSAIASHAIGIAPMSAIGRPQAASATAEHRPEAGPRHPHRRGRGADQATGADRRGQPPDTSLAEPEQLDRRGDR